MSSSGILNSGAVVFYHPLDNSTEHTLSQDWVGSAEYATSEVGSGIFSNIGNVVTVDNVSGVLSEGFLPQGLANAAKLTDTKFVIVYPETANVVGVRVVNISGTTPIYGTEYLFDAVDVIAVYVAALSPSSILIMHNSGDTPTDRSFIRQLDIDESDVVTSGASLIMTEFAHNTITACAIDETRAFVSAGRGVDGGYAFMVEYSGGVLSSGIPIPVSDYRIGDTCFKLNSSGCVFNYRDSAVDGQVRLATIPATGIDVVSVGDAVEFSPTYGLGVQFGDFTNGMMCRLTDNKFMIFFKEGTQGRLMAASTSGEVITLGTDIQVITWFGHGQITRLTDTKSMVIYKNQDAFPVVSNARVASVDVLTVSLGSVYVFSDEDPGVTTGIGPINAIAGIDPASVFVFYSEHTATERRAKILHVDTSDMSLAGSGYPSMSGNTRVSACMWARNLTAPDSTAKIERGYSIEMTSGSITLGSGVGAAAWNDSAIETLMASINDGESHFLVLDFENTGSNWGLNTSIDGADWVDQGNQDSGSLSPVTTDTSGQVAVTDPEPGQWIDEAVLWGGNKATLDKFTTNELFSLFSLAGSGLTMNQFEEGESPASLITGSADLFIFSLDSITSSGDLYIAGPIGFTGSGNLFVQGAPASGDSTTAVGRPLDWLLKTSDHNPQLIGTLGSDPSDVNIRVWDITDGQNTLMALASSGCYQIGYTGRWGWSTANLPASQGNARHYFYTMVSDLNMSFDGQFLLDVPESAKWIHPSNMGDYLL